MEDEGTRGTRSAFNCDVAVSLFLLLLLGKEIGGRKQRYDILGSPKELSFGFDKDRPVQSVFLILFSLAVLPQFRESASGRFCHELPSAFTHPERGKG